MLELRLVVGNIVLSLRPGGGDALTRGLRKVSGYTKSKPFFPK